MEAVELYMVEMGAEEGEKLVPGCVRVDFLAICESLVDFEDGEADLYVVGGCRELGFWNPNNALKLKRLSGSRDLWRGSVHVSAEAMPQLEYKYVAKRTVVIPYIGDDPVTGMAWERQVAGNRHCDVSSFQYTGRGFVEDKDICFSFKRGGTVTFRIHYNLKPTERMFITGDPIEIGGWINPGPVPMHLTEPQPLPTGGLGRFWELIVPRPLLPSFDYRYIIKDSETGIVRWEREPNRKCVLDVWTPTIIDAKSTGEKESESDACAAEAPVNSNVHKVINDGENVVINDVNFISSMEFDEIPPSFVIGPYPQSEDDILTLKKAGVTAVLSVQTNDDIKHREVNWDKLVSIYKREGIVIERHAIEDFNAGSLKLNLYNAAVLLEKILSAGGKNSKVYVHCTAGMSRAPSTVIMCMVCFHGWGVQEAYDHVKKHRPVIAPNMHIVRQVAEKYAPEALERDAKLEREARQEARGHEQSIKKEKDEEQDFETGIDQRKEVEVVGR